MSQSLVADPCARPASSGSQPFLSSILCAPGSLFSTVAYLLGQATSLMVEAPHWRVGALALTLGRPARATATRAHTGSAGHGYGHTGVSLGRRPLETIPEFLPTGPAA